jgi:hypothetical protein
MQQDSVYKMATKPELKYTATQGQANEKKGNYPSSLVYQIIMQEAQRRGYSWFKQHHALAMMGSFIQETGNFRKDVIDFDIRGDGGTAHGLMQWRGPRYNNLVEYSKRTGLPPQDIRAQVSFAFEEGSQGSPYADPGSVRAFREFPQAKGVQDASVSFIHAERPAGYSSDNPGAANDAQKRVSHAMNAGNSLKETGIDTELQNYDFTTDGQYGNVPDNGNDLSFGKQYNYDMNTGFGLPEYTGNKNTDQVNSFVNQSSAFADQYVGGLKGNKNFSYASMFGAQ